MSEQEQITEQPESKQSLPAPEKKKRLKLILAGITLVVFGMIIGSGLTIGIIGKKFRELAHNPEKIPAHMTRHLERKLDLTTEQTVKVGGFIDEAFDFFMKKRVEHYPENRARVEQLNSEIESILTPEQKEEFKEMREHFMSKWRPPALEPQEDN